MVKVRRAIFSIVFLVPEFDSWYSTGSINARKPRNTRLKLIDPWCAGCVRARVFTRMLNTCVGAWYPLTTRLNHFLRLLLDFPWDAAVAGCLLLLTILALIYSGVFFIFARAFLEKLHRATNFILRACLKKFYYFSSLFILFFFSIINNILFLMFLLCFFFFYLIAIVLLFLMHPIFLYFDIM